MATITKEQLRLARTEDGTSYMKMDLPEKASQVWSAGSLITLDANGYVELQTGDDQATYYGIAINAGQNTATDGLKKCEIIRLSSKCVFIATMLEAANANHVLVQADHGPMGIIYDDAVKRFCLDASEQGGADDRVLVLGPAPGSKVGDTNARVYCTFLAAAIQGN